MDSIQRRDPLAFEISGYAFIGRQHEFFNDAVRDVAFRLDDAFHQAEFVEFDDRFR